MLTSALSGDKICPGNRGQQNLSGEPNDWKTCKLVEPTSSNQVQCWKYAVYLCWQKTKPSLAINRSIPTVDRNRTDDVSLSAHPQRGATKHF